MGRVRSEGGGGGWGVKVVCEGDGECGSEGGGRGWGVKVVSSLQSAPR